jgi:hypothetical protein
MIPAMSNLNPRDLGHAAEQHEHMGYKRNWLQRQNNAEKFKY